MYKYLLPLLVSFPVNAAHHFGTYHFKSGTITIRGGTDVTSATTKALTNGKGTVTSPSQAHETFTSDLIVTHKLNGFMNYPGGTVTHQLSDQDQPGTSKTINLEGMRYDTVVPISEISTESGNALMYQFSCDLPPSIENPYVDRNEISLGYRAVATIPAYPEFKYTLECSVIYERERAIELSLSPDIVDISGSNTDELKGETELTLIGSHGAVYMEIKNPNYLDLSVSFDENRIVEQQSFLVNNSTHKFPIFVKAKAKEPGAKTYSVSINATLT
ncbi:TPA: hypothetical protein JTH82_004964 [Escherichia coli]|nr:hypothetical protein [Escherichia coli]